jgi:hypothetical protein
MFPNEEMGLESPKKCPGSQCSPERFKYKKNSFFLLFLMKGPVKNEGGDPVDVEEISYPVRHIRAHVHAYSQYTVL